MSNVQQRRKRTEEPSDQVPTSTSQSNNESKKLKKTSSSSIFSNILMGLVWTVILFFGASYLITESWTWGYRGKWTNINNYLPVSI